MRLIAWPQPSGVVRSSAGDTRMPRDTTPQYQTDEDRRLASEQIEHQSLPRLDRLQWAS